MTPETKNCRCCEQELELVMFRKTRGDVFPYRDCTCKFCRDKQRTARRRAQARSQDVALKNAARAEVKASNLSAHELRILQHQNRIERELCEAV